jgi:L-serine dehydratase
VYTSVFEVLRAGPGPSSVQTQGPLVAAREFVHALEADGLGRATARIDTELYGGLACASRESATAEAIIAGLAGAAPADCDGAALRAAAATVKTTGTLALNGHQPIAFDAERDIAFRVDRTIAGASHALRFVARSARGEVLVERDYYSIGDGDVVTPTAALRVRETPRIPYPYESAAELGDSAEVVGKKIAAMGFANETTFRSPGEARQSLLGLGALMQECVQRGLATDAALPGGRSRRAPAQAIALRGGGTPAQWCSVMAQAAAEENAAGGLVVAAPTAGSAGPVAALLTHWLKARPLAEESGTIEFLITAGMIGGLLRSMGLRQAGCQGVVGVASAMAAAGYAAVLGGSNGQVLYAAELALAPHLGQACDPDGGRIQQPCIARNAAAAAHAHASAQAALARQHPRNGLDNVIAAMIDSARGMAGRYKAVSLGGNAINVTEC